MHGTVTCSTAKYVLVIRQSNTQVSQYMSYSKYTLRLCRSFLKILTFPSKEFTGRS